MKLKPAIFLFLVVFTTAFFSACASVESKNSEEVVIEDKTNGSPEEVFITNADTKKEENLQISTSQASSELPKRILPDNSEIVTLVDGYGNKTETRNFPGNTRIRFVSLRTSVDGVREVTVYAANGSAKIVTDLGDEAMTLPGDQIANTAQISTTQSSPVLRNYMKRGKTDSKTPLQPLPSSSFQKPVMPVNQPTEPTNTSEKPSPPSNEEDED